MLILPLNLAVSTLDAMRNAGNPCASVMGGADVERCSVHLDEMGAKWVAEALRAEVARVRAARDEARDRADRKEWALLDIKWRSLGNAMNGVEGWLRDNSMPSADAHAWLRDDIHRKSYRMPRSKANEPLLRAERETIARQIALAQLPNDR